MSRHSLARSWRKPFALLSLLVVAGAPNASAGNHWLSDSHLVAKAAPWRGAALWTQPQTERAYDVTISLYNNPSPADRLKYEKIIQCFADGVYESTNGGHKIGRVSIFTGNQMIVGPDVLWQQDGWPHTTMISSRNQAGRINMYDNFVTDRGTLPFMEYQNLMDAGYTLAHEWGHYAYGLLDEYRGDSLTAGLYSPLLTDFPIPNAIMNNQSDADESNSTALNFSTADDYPFGRFLLTAQGRFYGADCWTVLTRPADQDPPRVFNYTGYPRDAAMELLPFRPPIDKSNRHVELPPLRDRNATTPSRNALDIRWMTNKVVYEIVIDHSGSMDPDDKMENAKSAAQALIDILEVGNSAVGIIQFDDDVETVVPITNVDGVATKSAIKSEIQQIQPDGSTAIGDAAMEALRQLNAWPENNVLKVVFLLTDGENNTGEDPRSPAVLMPYQNARVPLFTFGYGLDLSYQNEAVQTLVAMAAATNGKYYNSPTNAKDLAAALQDANSSVSASVGLATGTGLARPGAPLIVPVTVDASIGRLDASVAFHGDPSGAAVVLVDPQGRSVSPTSQTQAGDETLNVFSLASAAPGAWQLRVTATSGEVLVDYNTIGWPAEQDALQVTLESLPSTTVNYPEPVLLLATLTKEYPVAGARVTGSVRMPDGQTTIITFHDDGVAPDEIAADGRYAAIFDPPSDGFYDVTAAFDNSNGQAAETDAGVLRTQAWNGAAPTPVHVPIAGPFQRFARVQVLVQGHETDDHGNSPAVATELETDNERVLGRMDYDGDKDVFAFVVPDGTQGVTFRVSDLALGMDPAIRILGGDGATVLAQGTVATAKGERGYPVFNLAAPAGTRMYAEVSHAQAKGRGTYNVSVGPALYQEGYSYSLAWGAARLPGTLVTGRGSLAIRPAMAMRSPFSNSGPAYYATQSSATVYTLPVPLTNAGGTKVPAGELSVAYRWTNAATGAVVSEGSYPLNNPEIAPNRTLTTWTRFAAPPTTGRLNLTLSAAARSGTVQQTPITGTMTVSAASSLGWGRAPRLGPVTPSVATFVPGDGRTVSFTAPVSGTGLYVYLGEWNGAGAPTSFPTPKSVLLRADAMVFDTSQVSGTFTLKAAQVAPLPTRTPLSRKGVLFGR